MVNLPVRRGIVESRDELTLLDNADDVDPSITQLADAAVSGSIPAGPEIHQAPPVSLRGELEVAVVSPLCASSLGFALHAATTVCANDARAREALARYIVRPPLAQERLQLLPNNLVRIELKRAFRDGDAEEWLENHTVAIDLDPLSILCRLAAAVPPPGFHLVHYAGVLGAASKLQPPRRSPARDPPYFKSKVLRRKFGELN